MELFSEIFGCYYTVVGKILSRAAVGITKGEIDGIVADNAFSESGLHLLPKLLSGEWDLLRREGELYVSKLSHAETGLPLTGLQKAWLAALLRDRRIRLFLDSGRIAQMEEQLRQVEPLFLPEDFHIFDAAADGDDYTSGEYIRIFRTVLQAIKSGTMLLVEYQRGEGRPTTLLVLPKRLLYSAKDDKFRAVGHRFMGTGCRKMILNLARIRSATPVEDEAPPRTPQAQKGSRESVTLAISGERNALERCMMQFASYDKQTVWDEAVGKHICRIFYSAPEETELLIRILSFGPVVEVLGPRRFLQLVRKRVRRQLELLDAPV